MSWPIAIVAAPPCDHCETRTPIKRQRRLVGLGNLKEGAGGATSRRFVEEPRYQQLSQPGAARIGQDGDGQQFRLVGNRAAKGKARGMWHQKTRGRGAEIREFCFGPGARHLKTGVVDFGKPGGGHGRITGGASRDGAASAGRR